MEENQTIYSGGKTKGRRIDERSGEIKGVRQDLKPYMNEQFNYPKDSDKEIPNLKY